MPWYGLGLVRWQPGLNPMLRLEHQEGRGGTSPLSSLITLAQAPESVYI